MAATLPNVISLVDDDDDDVIEVLCRKRRRLDPPAATATATHHSQCENPVATVLDVFPDADIQFVTTTLEKYDQKTDFVIASMAENGYTKRKVEANQKLVAETEINFMSVDSFQPTALYCEQVETLLSNEFSFLSVRGTRDVLRLVRYHYAMAHHRVWMAARGNPGIADELEQYRRFYKIQILGRHIEFITDLRQSLGAKTVIKKSRRKAKPLLTEKTLVSEMKFVKKKVSGWMDEMSTRNARALNKAKADKDGTGMDCSCCFDSFPIEDMIVCRNEGHLFCSQCLKSFVENQIFGQGNLGVDKKTKKPALELQCFSGDCNSVFDRTFLTRSLPAKTLEAYDKMQVTVNMTAAGLAEKVYSCPKCDFQAEVFPSLRVFSCSQCFYESCVLCGEKAHVPLRCDEAMKERKETCGRVAVEEAISSALIRKCPSCKKPFIKESGCNKITCACGTKCCYLCSAIIRDYSHFCQVPHCTHKEGCTSCPLYSNDAQDAARAMRKAGLDAAQKVHVEAGIVDQIMK